MALDTPAISTDCPSGPGEIFINGMEHSLVACGNVEALAEKMRDFYDKTSSVNKESLMRFEASRIAQEYLDLIP